MASLTESFGGQSGPLLANAERKVNVGPQERRWSLIAGALFGISSLLGLRRSLLRTSLLGALGGFLLYRGRTGYCALYDALGQDSARDEREGVRFVRSLTINRPVAEVYRYWRDLDNLPRFMRHLDAVIELDPRRSQWIARLPGNVPLQWEAELTEERENEALAWRTLPGAAVQSEGRVTFRTAARGRGTEVSVTMAYRPRAGLPGLAVARLVKTVTDQALTDDLRRFKQILETGEVPTTEGQSKGMTPPRQRAAS